MARFSLVLATWLVTLGSASAASAQPAEVQYDWEIEPSFDVPANAEAEQRYFFVVCDVSEARDLSCPQRVNDQNAVRQAVVAGLTGARLLQLPANSDDPPGQAIFDIRVSAAGEVSFRRPPPRMPVMAPVRWVSPPQPRYPSEAVTNGQV